jgi:Bacterial SH3 domain/GW (Gly-Tryp) dipeptide domain
MAEFLESLMIVRKSLVVGLLSVTALMVAALPGMARPATINIEVNLRSGPSIKTTRIDGLPAGTNVEVLKIVNANDGEYNWYYVRSTGKLRTEGWVTNSAVNFNRSSQQYGTLAGGPDDRINIRSARNTRSEVLHTGVLGDLVTVDESRSTVGDGYSRTGTSWHHVTYPSGAAGWVRGDLINIWPKGCIITCPDGTDRTAKPQAPAVEALLIKGMTDVELRKILSNSGWVPLVSADEKEDVNACSGTGYCRTFYEDKTTGIRLKVITYGREQSLEGWEFRKDGMPLR